MLLSILELINSFESYIYLSVMNANTNKENTLLILNTIKTNSKPLTKYKSLENKNIPKLQFNFTFQQNSNLNPQSIHSQVKNTPQFASIHSSHNQLNHVLKYCQNIKPKKLKFPDCSLKDVLKNVRYVPLIQRSNKIPEPFLRPIKQKKRSLGCVSKCPSLDRNQRVSLKEACFNDWYSKRIQKIQEDSKNMKGFRLIRDQVERMNPYFSDKTNVSEDNLKNGMKKVSLKYKKVVKML